MSCKFVITEYMYLVNNGYP